ncbi:chromate transporter [Halobacillus halophilus]|uniref:Chromate transporter n=1 Tax=Halobacillus halophilus (strain ATCC 35676 / DSM 2266 / JCM 20832 / KCTC 3685 / LMG 17431 / NBRC 102448 / NCIMB 2269) TaxID=866895 RepID=I0JJ23_HALH3|nr:chromate transporter [Halobacillus halophilus]ASF38306.1 chromate transporter [Halobacillus halophilus]CCG44141.1 chromate transporter [Halobacillus halophilus DSM 2266]
MIFWKLFVAFFIPGIIGYGGGPASIPLVENEVVGRFGWMSVTEFSEMLAMANALPGPIATKMAGFIGYQQAGVLGAVVGVFATVTPSLILMIVLLSVLYKFKDSPRVKRMTNLIRPAIAVLLGIMAYQFFWNSYEAAGFLQTVILIIASFLLLEKVKLHPAFVILGSLIYGALFLG